jgi:diguanylate cyclase (GGDEF)-like protein
MTIHLLCTLGAAAMLVAFGATVAGMRRRIARQTHAADVIVALNAMLQTEIDELQQRAQDVEMLGEMSELLQISTTFGEACEVLPAFGARLFPGLTGAVFTSGATPGLMTAIASWRGGLTVSEFPITECWALRRVQVHSGSAAGVRCPHAETLTGATVCVPMLALGEAIGVVTFNAPDASSIAPMVEQFARTFAEQIAFAFANLRLQETLRMRAVRDGLTGLYNRRYLDEVLSRELLRAARCRHQVGVLMVDVDHFKRFNDTHGHAGGDALLQQFARLMQSVVREEDIVCRYGGEEFVVVLPDADTSLLHATAEAVLEAARQLRVHLDGDELRAITASAGIALSNEHGTSAAGIIAAADRALYNAKATGRDRVAGPLPRIVGADAT